jgi:hypothetical protein
MAAFVAMDAQESVGEYAALEIGPDLPLDEAGDRRTRRTGAFEEGLEVVADDAVEERLLGLVSFVPNRGCFAGTGVDSTSLSKRHAGGGIAGPFGSHHRLRKHDPVESAPQQAPGEPPRPPGSPRS